MAFNLTHRYGSMDSGSSNSDFLALLRELDDWPEDTEHGSVAVTHESEWSLAASRGGYITFENLEAEGRGERHMDEVPASKILELFRHLVEGNLAAIEQEPWLPGY
ncbi:MULTISPECIES: hypothetical protein [unclassified Variovorax]|jgi:hypothetical protein|uniref:hypothetical protein n=1 Tax=unclassified Variovorax TaxID=663243 RepID=UPI0008CD590B|nr:MULTISPECIES: hypothetical protein [unclassified Variovorax]SEK17010.1 hypothetical protein SAMN05518853_1346 [Variovorax sp. OK202]SFE68147.1 hypothetical protein SAMN05444746_1336 [Variovorax sp. OK212]